MQEAAAVLKAGEFELGGHPVHTVATVAPVTAEYVPARQSVHVPLPVAVLYLPAVHDVHMPPLGPVYPALQVQCAMSLLAPGDVEFLGHRVHDDAPSREYVPAGQKGHATDKAPTVDTGLYLPAGQGQHADGGSSNPPYPSSMGT